MARRKVVAGRRIGRLRVAHLGEASARHVPEIAARLFVSHNTVRSEVGSIYRKLGVSSRSDAVRHATAAGLFGA